MYKDILLTGGSGRLGTELLKTLDCWHPSSSELNIVDIIPSKFYEKNADKLSHIKTIVHCAAYTDVPNAEKEKDKCIDANIIGTKNISMLAKIIGAKVMYISTDYVYSGQSGNYKEEDKPEPFNFYGFTKYCGEAFMDLGKDLVIRTSFKPSNWPYPKAFSDLYCSADYIDIISEKILFLINKYRGSGVINVGTERKSIYELAKRRNPSVLPMSRKEIKNVKMPVDISMDTSKFNSIYNKVSDD